MSFYAECLTLGKRGRYRESYFIESGIRQKMICPVLDKMHSAKRRALAKEPDSGSVRN
jgi:hypothetical protein